MAFVRLHLPKAITQQQQLEYIPIEFGRSVYMVGSYKWTGLFLARWYPFLYYDIANVYLKSYE